MRRGAKRGLLAALAVLVTIAAPIGWIELACTAPLDPNVRSPAPLVRDAGYARRESDSYLSFPEWHIVYAYEDLAGVVRRADESAFAYGRQIAGFWCSLCSLTRVATARAPVGGDTRVMLYTIGWSFTVELAIKGVYEKTVGRAFEWLRGDGKTAEDTFAARDLQAYATFLRQTPWYQYPFGARLAAFWRDTPLRGPGLARKIERRVVFTLDYGVKTVYGALIGWASATTLGAADLEIQTVMLGVDDGDAARDPRIHIVRGLDGGRVLIRTPRYQAYTDLLVGLARRDRDVVEIAGNRRILVTVLAPEGPLPPLADTTALFEAAIQATPGRRRVGLDVGVEHLAAAIRALEPAGATVEHVYDY